MKKRKSILKTKFHSFYLVLLILIVAVVWGSYRLMVQKPQVAEVAGSPRMYIDKVFPAADVTYDVIYSTMASTVRRVTTYDKLKMDVYQPQGDTRSARPLLILVHGGGFTVGDKNIFGGDYASAAFGWGRYFAERGYVVFSINYRMASPDLADQVRGLEDPLVESIVRKAKSDMFASVRYGRIHAGEYRIDPNHVFLAGNSAGAVLAMYGAYGSYDLGDNLTNPGVSSLVQGAVALSGAIYPKDLGKVVVGMPPALMFAGALDTTVPYAWSVGLRDKLQAVGVRVDWYSFPDKGHQVAGYKESAPIVAQFLAELIGWSPSNQPPIPTSSLQPSPLPSVVPSVRPTNNPVPTPFTFNGVKVNMEKLQRYLRREQNQQQ